MNEVNFKEVAAQLRQPNGEYAIQVAEKMNDGNLLINRNTIEALDIQDGEQLLEIGMSNGFFVKDILSAASNLKYTGCDHSAEMVAEARKNNRQFIKSGQASFHHTGADELPFPENSIDKVFTINTIYFWEDQQKVLSEIHKILKPSGKVYIALRPKRLMKDFPFTKYGFNMFSGEDIRQLLSTHHFHVTDMIEKQEPDRDINGELVAVATLIVIAEKR